MSLRISCLALIISISCLGLTSGRVAGQQLPTETGKLTTQSLKKVLDDASLVAREMKNAKGEVMAWAVLVSHGGITSNVGVWVDGPGEFVFLAAKLSKVTGTPPAAITAGLLKANEEIYPYSFTLDDMHGTYAMHCPIANVQVTPKLVRARVDKLAIHLRKYRDLWDETAWSINGEWAAVMRTRKGIDEPAPSGLRMSVRDNSVISWGSGKADSQQFTLHPARTPMGIDITMRDGTDLGIYQVKGDELTICMAGRGMNRPSEFKADKDSQNELMVFRRVQKSPIDGVWVEMSHRRGGEVRDRQREVHRWVIAGGKIKITRPDDRDEWTFTFRRDLAAIAIDFTREGKGVIPAIYKLQGDELTVCFPGTIGDNRPGDFTAERDNHLIVLKKVKR